jgi:putative ABC transport system permease protein
MLAYYLDLAWRSLRKNVALTALMVLAIAFGVGSSMTTLTVMHVLGADPIPAKSHDLYEVQLDPQPMASYRPGEEPPEQLTWQDSDQLMKAKKADRQAIMTGGSVAIEPARADLQPFYVDSRWTSADFFPMFDVPFAHGAPWTAADDDAHAHVVVITRALAEKLFGTADAVGKSVRVEKNEMRVVGVLDDWHPIPHFYDLNNGAFAQPEQLFAPWSTSRDLKFGHNGDTDCWAANEDSSAYGAPCVWTQFWVEADGADHAAAYRSFLVSYSNEQHRQGRFKRPVNVRMRDVMDWLQFKKVVPEDVTLQTWLALGFLIVCLVNTVGLLLTKFMRRSAEIGVRRALGASKRSVFLQLLVEAGMIGLVGGVVGLGLAYLGLWAVHHQPTAYAELAHLDGTMLAATFALAVVSSLLAGLLPAWRGCQVAPALQLKSH